MFIVNSKSGESFELRRDEASKMLKWKSAVSRVSNTLLIKHFERLFSPLNGVSYLPIILRYSLLRFFSGKISF